MTNNTNKIDWITNAIRNLIPHDEECVEFYYKAMHDYDMGINDADDYAYLNTLFQYDIGAERALAIIRWFYIKQNTTVQDAVILQERETLKNCEHELGFHFNWDYFLEDEPRTLQFGFTEIPGEALVQVGMYADQTGLFNEDEIMYDNWVDVLIPARLVKKWYEENNLAEDTASELEIPASECTWRKWLNEVSYGDDTDGLYDFCIANGYTPDIDMSEDKNSVFYRDECNYKYYVYQGTTNECRKFCRENDWEWCGYDLELLHS